jgi:hypothetical protein
VDASSFTAGADYRIYAATMTGFSGSADTLRDVIVSDGMAVLEADAEERANGSASRIAGTVLATVGTYCASQFNTASLPDPIRLYDVYVRVRFGSSRPEMEPNDKDVPEVPRSSGWRIRVIEPGTAKEDTFAITVNGCDTIGVIVSADLERGAPEWKVIAGTGVFTGSFIISL